MVNFYDCFVIPDCTNNRATVDDVVSKAKSEMVTLLIY